ncbi:hypothetical protein TSOC_009150 [Tetrabaena socialis]|uniref:Uncharacterized protein n=1 Tax=Tetrabaena socialis TaxID=47790 RepID=A0A2J7ZWM9_9CHLO|nr:hypothetical protein TSOC_009150 [Tetrabaena socialis]|eukprot:PNH04662.1 hypothetical protein TSOC_009150 [Tetrabaena socialis]
MVRERASRQRKDVDRECPPESTSGRDASPDCTAGHFDRRGGMPIVNDLERERQAHMARNQQRLQELGLLPLLTSMRQEAGAPAAAKAAAKKRRAEEQENAGAGEERVLRRSLRGKGQEPELPPLLESVFRRPERPYRDPGEGAPPWPRVEAGGADAAKFDAHNLHRLRTMGDDAMLKRIGKISNTLKLASLVQVREKGRESRRPRAEESASERARETVTSDQCRPHLLRHFGRDELAEEAQAALDARLANV